MSNRRNTRPDASDEESGEGKTDPGTSGTAPVAAGEDRTGRPSDAPPRAAVPGFLPSEPARRGAESVLSRLIATAGVIGIGTAVGAILSASDVESWITALVVSTVSVVLSAVLWRSRRL